MASSIFILGVLLGLMCVQSVQALTCLNCTSISEEQPSCPEDDIQPVICGGRFTHCIRIVLNKPAFGEIRRCATTKECEASVTDIVERSCCNDKDECNVPSS